MNHSDAPTPTPTSTMRRDSAYEAEIAALKKERRELLDMHMRACGPIPVDDSDAAIINSVVEWVNARGGDETAEQISAMATQHVRRFYTERLVAVEAERDAAKAWTNQIVISHGKIVEGMQSEINHFRAIIATARAAPDAVEAAMKAWDHRCGDLCDKPPCSCMQAALTAANLKAIKTIEDAQAAPDAVEAMENAFWECDGNTSDSLKAALTAANINIAAEREKVTPTEEALMHEVDELEAKLRTQRERSNILEDIVNGYLGVAGPLRVNILADRERAEKAEAERDRLVPKYKALVAWYDKYAGTPCEQIRHAQELADAQTRAWTEGRDAAQELLLREGAQYHGGAAYKDADLYEALAVAIRALQPPAEFSAAPDTIETPPGMFPLINHMPEAADLCSGCPPVGYPTDKTRCKPCPRRTALLAAPVDQGSTMEDIFGKAPAYSSARYPAWQTAEHWRDGNFDPFRAPADSAARANCRGDMDYIELPDDEYCKLIDALEGMTKVYVDLINSGGAPGSWNPEEQPEVIAARAALLPSRSTT